MSKRISMNYCDAKIPIKIILGLICFVCSEFAFCRRMEERDRPNPKLITRDIYNVGFMD